jgi:hypothetical protein
MATTARAGPSLACTAPAGDTGRWPYSHRRPCSTPRVFGIFALQIIFTWLYNSAGASVLIAMVAHLFSNVRTATVKPLFSPADQERYWLIMNAVEFLVALGVLIATRGRLGLKPTNERAVANAE